MYKRLISRFEELKKREQRKEQDWSESLLENLIEPKAKVKKNTIPSTGNK